MTDPYPYIDHLVSSLLNHMYRNGDGSARLANLWEHLHYYQGCKECKEAWHKVGDCKEFHPEVSK